MDIRCHRQRLFTLLLFSTLAHGALIWLGMGGAANKPGEENVKLLKVILVQAPKTMPNPTQVQRLVKPVPAPKPVPKQKPKPLPAQTKPAEEPVAALEPTVEQAAEWPVTVQEMVVSVKPDPIVIEPVFKAPRPITTNPKPHYPLAARRRGLQGEVMLVVELDEQGHVVRSRIQRSSGYPVLDRAAEYTVSRWRFTPALSDGEAVTASVEVPIMFDLN